MILTPDVHVGRQRYEVKSVLHTFSPLRWLAEGLWLTSLPILMVLLYLIPGWRARTDLCSKFFGGLVLCDPRKWPETFKDLELQKSV